MITLDYQTNNPRWGWSGMAFVDWISFSLTLGFLSNKRHHKGNGTGASVWCNSISIHVEGNDQDGAWYSEGRIHYYGTMHDLQTHLPDLHAHSSAGNTSATCRINSNGYIINSLIADFNFQVCSYGYISDVYPPLNSFQTVRSILVNHLNGLNGVLDVPGCLDAFEQGFFM